ncbi:MAG: Ig-like domain-containing protein [Piscinibacter sp.]
MSTASKSRSQGSMLLRSMAAALLALGGAQATAQTTSVTLCAEPYLQSLPVVGNVPMWGYRQVAAAAECDSNAGVGTASPGPLITVPAGNTTLAITLVNKLTVPTSVVISGQRLPSNGGAPVMAADLFGAACTPTPGAAPSAPEHPQNCRVRSFTGETDPGTARLYTFSNLKPGTYLYQSGTHPQVQVQMGLFGMARQDAPLLSGSSVRQLFVGTDAGFDVDVPVVLSEIDPDQHARISQTLGSADPASWKAGNNSTFNYAPRFFLINGRVFDGSSANDLVANAGSGSRVILRLANAGLQSRSLMLNSGTWKLLTEDGNPYPAAREQATTLLPAGKTSDAQIISTAPTNGSTSRALALFDRRGGTDNADGTALGGQVARIAQTGPAVPFIAPIADQVANEGATPYTLQVNGGNITTYSLSSGAPAGMTIDASGLITWTSVPTGTVVPTSYSITVTGDDADANTAAASRTFALRINHRPTMGNVIQNVAHGAITVAAPGLLSAAADPDGDAPMSVVQTSAPSAGTLLLNADGSYSWSGPQPATGTSQVSFGVASRDPYGLQSNPATVTLNVAANVAPLAANDAYTITLARGALNVPLSVTNATQIAALTRPVATLTANDSDDGTVVATTIAAVVPVPPLSGTISARRINPNSPVGCTTNCATINPGIGQAQASVSFNTAAGTFMLTPHTLLSVPVPGTYEFRYTIRDDQNALSNQAVVRVTVN